MAAGRACRTRYGITVRPPAGSKDKLVFCDWSLGEDPLTANGKARLADLDARHLVEACLRPPNLRSAIILAMLSESRISQQA